MSDSSIKVENLSKQYRLGLVGTGTLTHDLNRWWHQVRGKEDPYLKIGETNDRATKGKSDYVWALKDINFEVKQGEVLGIIGKNGAGKSTLLKLLSRVTTPTTGEIKAKGRIASLLEVGTGFHPELTGRDNIYLNGAILGMTKAEIKSKFDEIVEFSGAARYIDTPVKRYSSGMRVRLAFAVAAYLEPEILIVDEVLAVGDAEFQKKAIGKMKEVSKGEGRTVLFVSHNMAAVQNLCTHGLLLMNGTVLNIGNTNEIVKQYLSINQKQLSTGYEEFEDEGKEAWVHSITLKNSQKETTSKLKFGEKFSVKLKVECNIDVSNLEPLIAIDTSNEIRVFTSSSGEQGMSYSVKKDSSVEVEAFFDNLVLVPGEYSLVLALRSGKTQQFDVIFNALKFEITEEAYIGVVPHNGSWGVIRVNPVWKF